MAYLVLMVVLCVMVALLGVGAFRKWQAWDPEEARKEYERRLLEDRAHDAARRALERQEGKLRHARVVEWEGQGTAKQGQDVESTTSHHREDAPQRRNGRGRSIARDAPAQQASRFEEEFAEALVASLVRSDGAMRVVLARRLESGDVSVQLALAELLAGRSGASALPNGLGLVANVAKTMPDHGSPSSPPTQGSHDAGSTNPAARGHEKRQVASVSTDKEKPSVVQSTHLPSEVLPPAEPRNAWRIGVFAVALLFGALSNLVCGPPMAPVNLLTASLGAGVGGLVVGWIPAALIAGRHRRERATARFHVVWAVATAGMMILATIGRLARH